MPIFLSRLGRLAFRRRGLTVLVWLLLFGGIAVAASAAAPSPADTFSMPGPDGGRISDPGPRTHADKLVADLAKAPNTADVAEPFPSRAVSRACSRAHVTFPPGCAHTANGPAGAGGSHRWIAAPAPVRTAPGRGVTTAFRAV